MDIDDKWCVILNSKVIEDKYEEIVEEVIMKEYYIMKMLFGGVIENSFNDSLYMEMGFLYRFKIEKVFFVNGIVFFFVMES